MGSAKAFARWIAFGLVSSGCIPTLLIDCESDDLIVHFLAQEGPPFHRKNCLYPKAFEGIEQIGELFKKKKKNQKIQKWLDEDLTKAIAKKIGVKSYYSMLKIKNGTRKDIGDLDLYIPRLKLWVELTTSYSNTDSHFTKKLGEFHLIKHLSPLKVKNFYIDPITQKKLIEEVEVRVHKFFYISLFPIELSKFPFNYKNTDFAIFSFFKKKKTVAF